jgi:hypothetical protein
MRRTAATAYTVSQTKPHLNTNVEANTDNTLGDLISCGVSLP